MCLVRAAGARGTTKGDPMSVPERGILEWWYELLIKALVAREAADALLAVVAEGNDAVALLRDDEADE